MTNQSIVHAYRHLYRQGLRAVQFSKPARFTLRDRLRLAFRTSSEADFDVQKVENTLEFLKYATKETGLEHKLVKNLIFVWWVQAKGGIGRSLSHVPAPTELEIKTTVYDAFNYNIRMLNESMNMCIPSATVRDPR